jgi:hypothetical protein
LLEDTGHAIIDKFGAVNDFCSGHGGSMKSKHEEYTSINARFVDSWVERAEMGQAIDHETFLRAMDGDWSVVLTPTFYATRAVKE